MRYFIDAEFNGFGGELISLALVPDQDALAPFYEAVECTALTEWVAEHVLPVLQTQPLARPEVAKRLADYLIDDEDPLLVADWPEDIAHAARLLITGPGRMSPVRSVRFELVDPDIVGPLPESEIPHNALSDARALRAAVRDYERRMARI